MSSTGKELFVRISILEFKDKSPITLISILNSEILLPFLSSQFQKDMCILTYYLSSPIISPQNSLYSVHQEVMALRDDRWPCLSLMQTKHCKDGSSLHCPGYDVVQQEQTCLYSYKKETKRIDIKQQSWNQADISQNKTVEDFISTGINQPLGAKRKDVICSNTNLLIVSLKMPLQ